MSDQKVPTSRLVRLGKLAALGARTGASLLASKDGAGAAARSAEVLGSMRGLAAKIGQVASYVDGFVPENHREAYTAALRMLRDNTPTSSYAAVRSTLEEELGAPIDALFSRFEEAPFASASIGQVHRAWLPGGEEVAVKVQHAGIREAVEADLANASILESFARFGGGTRLNTKGILARVKLRFREELDYALEADRQEAFRAFHAGDPTIRVPRVVRSHSAGRVLTSEFVHGATLDEAATRGEASRRAHAETLWRFVFRGNLVFGTFNADPQPGNYLFGDDGVVTFLDFGCCEPLEPERQLAACMLHCAAIRRDDDAFARHAIDLLQTVPGKYQDFTLDYTRRCFEPLFRAPFKISRPYVAGLVAAVRDVKSIVLEKKSNFTPLPDGMVFINRLQFGFYSVLSTLDVEVDYRAVERAFLAETEHARHLG
ncbi:MAG: AarF/ABC1/UbiB kinase family protein [Polyangiaceae bacterium]